MKRLLLVASLLFLGAKIAFSSTSPSIRLVRSYPISGAQYVHPETNIGLSFPVTLSLEISEDSISVIGSSGHIYTGSLKLSLDRRTLIFAPEQHFRLGETITVRTGSFQTITGESTVPVVLTFTIRDKMATPDPDFHSDDPILERELHPNYFPSNTILSGAFDSLPIMLILKDDHPSEGNMYIANYTWQSIQPLTYGIVLDKDGNVKQVMGNGADYYNDFKPHPDATYSFFDAIKNKFFISDTGFHIVDSIVAPNGYVTDGHELRITSDNHYWLIGIDYVIVDMSKIIDQGRSQAVIVTPIVMEFDSQKNLIFEWRTLDHFAITDATYEDLRSAQIDFCHVNAISFDVDSNIVISCRNMDEVTKIDKDTGNVIWRWGGVNNQFKLVGDKLPFSHQHAVRRTEGGTFTMMDNGNFHNTPYAFSRALEFQLDQQRKIATEVWQFRHTPDVFSGAMGYVQRLPNKSTLIGWGECDSLSITEVDSNNIVRFDMYMPGGTYSYRAYKYDTNYVVKDFESVGSVPVASANPTLSCTPNPCFQHAKISCVVSIGSYGTLAVFDQLGRQISTLYSGYLSQGEHTFNLNTQNLAEGAYHIRASIGSQPPAEQEVIVMK